MILQTRVESGTAGRLISGYDGTMKRVSNFSAARQKEAGRRYYANAGASSAISQPQASTAGPLAKEPLKANATPLAKPAMVPVENLQTSKAACEKENA